MVTPVIELRDLRKRLDSGELLEGLTLRLYPGEFLGIVGPGVGKRVLVRVMSTLLPADGGEVWIDGAPSSSIERARRALGFCGGDVELIPESTVRGNLVFFARSQGLEEAYMKVRCDEILTLTRLSPLADTRMSTLKRTELRRAGLARALVHGPRVLLLDEPLQGLPDVERDLWVQILEQVRAMGCAVVMAGDTVREVRHLLTHACVLAEGRVLACGPIDSLDSRVSLLRCVHMQVVGAERAAAALGSWPGVFRATSHGDIIKVLFMGDGDEVLALVDHLTTEGHPVVSFRQEAAYLM